MRCGGPGCRRAAETPRKITITTSSAEARDAFLKGRDLAGKLRLTEAQPLLNEAVSKDPNFALAHLYLAQTAETPKGLFDHLKAAVAAAGKVSEGERVYIQGVEAGSNRDTKQRGECYQKLVVAFPDDEVAHMMLGIHYNKIQKSDEAVAEYRKAIQLAPGFAPAHNQLGYALREIEKNQDAEDASRRYIELIPNEPNPYDSLAELQMKTGRFAESIESYKRALSMNPQFLSAYRGMAANLMYQDKHKEALEQLQKAYGLATSDGEKRQLLSDMAVCYMDGNKLKDVIDASKTYYRKAAEAYILPDTEHAMIRQQAKKAMAK